MLNIHGGFEQHDQRDGSIHRLELQRRWPKFQLDFHHDYDLNLRRHLEEEKEAGERAEDSPSWDSVFSSIYDIYEKTALRLANGRSKEPYESFSASQLPSKEISSLAEDIPPQAGSKDLNIGGR